MLHAALIATLLAQLSAPDAGTRMFPAEFGMLSTDAGVVTVGPGCWLDTQACIDVGSQLVYRKVLNTKLIANVNAAHFELGLVFTAGLLLGASIVFAVRDWLKIPTWPWAP